MIYTQSYWKITNNVLQHMNYCGAYNPLDKQLIYDKNGNILKYIQNPSGNTDAICAQHDVDHSLT